jgi:HD superfamily phosphohydrolase
MLALSTIEKELLSKINIPNKKPISRITEQLTNGYIKIFRDNNKLFNNNNQHEFILKISGIWENESDYGITYKFIEEGDENL